MAITYDVTTGLRALDGANLISDIDAGVLSLAQDIANQRHALQAGAIDSGSYMVVQKAAGANMSVDVGSNSGRGMYVTDASSRLVFVAPTGSATNVAVTAAHATLPRIDIVTVSSAGVVAVTAGTATSGATLTNRTGAASVASGAQLIADILVAATVTTIPNTVIRDRRPWARGADALVTFSSSDPATTSGSYVAIDSTINPRIECSGAPLICTLRAISLEMNTIGSATVGAKLIIATDGVASGKAFEWRGGHFAGARIPLSVSWRVTPSAGSHQFAPYYLSNDSTATVTVRTALHFEVREIVAQDAVSNATTSG